jgi:hypothetical protein
MPTEVTIEPHGRGGWQVAVSGPSLGRFRVETRDEAERLAREKLSHLQAQRGTMIVRDAYHRIVMRRAFGPG